MFPVLERMLQLEAQGLHVHTLLAELRLLAWSRDVLRLGRAHLRIVKLNTTANLTELNPHFATFSSFAKVCREN